MKSSLKWSLIWNSWSALNSWKTWLALKKFTLHFPWEWKRSPEYSIFSEMKSSLKLVVFFELFEGEVGFECTHSSFPDPKRSPEYPIFSEMNSSLELVAVFKLFVLPAFDFPDRPEFFELFIQRRDRLQTVQLRLSGLEFFKSFIFFLIYQFVLFTIIYQNGKIYQNLVAMTIGIGHVTKFW